jgi:pimeloyl-ACP methyl ester carboxylesterase
MVGFLQAQPGIFRTATYRSYFLHNYLQTFQLEDMGGYLSVFPKSYAEFIYLSQPHQGNMPDGFSRWLDLEHLGHPLLSMAGMKYFVAPAGADLAPAKGKPHIHGIHTATGISTAPTYLSTGMAPSKLRVVDCSLADDPCFSGRQGGLSFISIARLHQA